MREEQYTKWRKYIDNQPSTLDQIKMKFENGEWQQTENHLDVFNSYEHVQNICDENLICWMDAYHYSIMKQNGLTNEIYQFIQHRSGVVREGFKEHFWYGFDKEMAKESAIDFLSFVSDYIF